MSEEHTFTEDEVQMLAKALIDAVPLDHLSSKQQELFSVMMQGYSAMGQKLELDMKEGLDVIEMMGKGIRAQVDQMEYYLSHR